MGDLMTAAYAQARSHYQLLSVLLLTQESWNLQLKYGIALWLQQDFSLLHRPYFILALGIGLEALQYRHVNQEPVGFQGSDWGC